MWLTFLRDYNGVSFFHARYWIFNVDTDCLQIVLADLVSVFGIYFKGHWCNARWPNLWRQKGVTSDIIVLELFPIVVALFLWARI